MLKDQAKLLILVDQPCKAIFKMVGYRALELLEAIIYFTATKVTFIMENFLVRVNLISVMDLSYLSNGRKISQKEEVK